MKIRLLLVCLLTGLASQAFAQSEKDYPPISFMGPSNARPTIDRDQFLVLVIEGSYTSHENAPITNDGTADYVSSALKAKGASYLAVHIREGVKYGDVVRALDVLRKSATKSIAVSLVELPIGREL